MYSSVSCAPISPSTGSLTVTGLRAATSMCIDRQMTSSPRFLNYVVGSRGFIRYTEAASKGVKMPRVEWMGLREFTVHRPNAIVQTRIADYLDRETGEIDAMLGKLDELTELLQVRRDAAVMKAIDSHFKGATVPLAFASDAKNFFDGDWVESRDQDPSGEIRLLQLADIGVGKFLDKSNRRVNQEAFERLACREVFPGDVLIARMPDPLGRACVLPNWPRALDHRGRRSCSARRSSQDDPGVSRICPQQPPISNLDREPSRWFDSPAHLTITIGATAHSGG